MNNIEFNKESSSLEMTSHGKAQLQGLQDWFYGQ
jgi:hypothetical protein